jgi:hypothetical protein
VTSSDKKISVGTTAKSAERPRDLRDFPLGFQMTPAHKRNKRSDDTAELQRAAVLLRMTYIDGLRQLQTSVNGLIVAAQEFTADPRTDSRLGLSRGGAVSARQGAGRRRTESAGSAQSRGSHGGASRTGDWTCPKCGANVFASKSACYKCGAKRGGGRDSGGDLKPPRGGGNRSRGRGSHRRRGGKRGRGRGLGR